jgi:hypothetical protein
MFSPKKLFFTFRSIACPSRHQNSSVETPNNTAYELKVAHWGRVSLETPPSKARDP